MKHVRVFCEHCLVPETNEKTWYNLYVKPWGKVCDECDDECCSTDQTADFVMQEVFFIL